MGSSSRDLESRINELQRQLEEEQRRNATSIKAAEDSVKESAATQTLVGELNKTLCTASLLYIYLAAYHPIMIVAISCYYKPGLSPCLSV